MNTAAMKLITGATLVHPQGHVGEGTVLIEGNQIRDITVDPPGSLLLNRPDVEIISGEGCYLTPGLIELHFNGAFGCNFNKTSISEIQTLLQKLPVYGITSILMTTITGPLEDMLSAVQTLEEAIHHKNPAHCRPLGLHLEGPFINRNYPGTHPVAHIRPLNEDELNLLMSPNLKMVTLAPELDTTGEFTQFLAHRGIRVSAGHTGARLEDIKTAIDKGLMSITHIYNAMRPFHHRDPGIIGAALTDDRLYVQMIGDGLHADITALRLVLRSKRPGHLLLVSDAMNLAGLPEGSHAQFAQQDITMRDGGAWNPAGKLAGSTQLLNDCLKNMVKWNLLRFPDAVQLATANPAAFLNEERLGRLETGCLADLVLWNKDTLDVEATWINGQIVYKKGQPAKQMSS